MEFVQKFTPLDFQVKNFTPSILPNFNSFSNKKAQKTSENGEIYTAGKIFTLPPAVTALTNFNSEPMMSAIQIRTKIQMQRQIQRQIQRQRQINGEAETPMV